MSSVLIHAIEAESALDALLWGDPQTLRDAANDATEERVNVLQIDVLVLDNRDVWYEFEMRRRLSEPETVVFVLRFTAETGFQDNCVASLKIADRTFTAPLDADGVATLTVPERAVLDPKSKRPLKPYFVGLTCA